MAMSEQNKLNNIKVIGFDLDNTLYHSTSEMQSRIRGLIYQKISSQLNISVEQAQNLFEGLYNSSNNHYSNSGSRTIEEIARRYDKDIDGSKLVQQSLEQADIVDLIPQNPELQEMLIRLNKRFDLDLLTGSAYYLATAKLKRIGINEELFEYILTGGKQGGKTDGSLYEYWLGIRKLKPNQALYVGDNIRQDIETPKNLGIKTCLVGKEDQKANFTINDILDLEKIIYS